MNVKTCVRALLCLYLTYLFSLPPVTAQVLKVGDSIPPELWDLTLPVVNHPEGKETVTLREHKDKLIILDFWATWCVPCIKSLNKLDNLQKEFGEQLAIVPVTRETSEIALKMIQKKEMDTGQCSGRYYFKKELSAQKYSAPGLGESGKSTCHNGRGKFTER
ncbi:MAG: TlpA family protein disulfide reductase [Leadbetterella sp.]|nr:TlpA family protein disulfide reductase [Leadbetterella sp.]